MNNESKKGNNFRWIIIAIIFLAAITNPDEEDFKDYLSNQMNEEDGGDDWLSSLLGDSVIDLVVDSSVKKNDYVVLTSYVIDFEGESTTYIGIFNNFFQID